KATDPENASERWDCMQEFYQGVNTHPDGPQIATRLLAHKIQSPQEKEALQALTLLEVCMNNCGKRFHNEAAKFRFLNELIKVLSPKYLGAWSTDEVKQRVTEVLYSWTQWLKDEPKVQEAYSMLKRQGIVKKDPKLPHTVALPPPSPRQEVSVFDNEDKSKLLSQLLKSSRAEDLQMANTLIKSTLQELEDTVNVLSETGHMEMSYRDQDYSTHNASVLAPVDPELQTRSSSNISQLTASGGLLEPRPVSSLADISVSLESIKPSHIKPITVFNHRGVHVSLHFTKEAPPSHPDVAVIIVSAVNTSPLPVSDFLFLAAVPKNMCVRLQAATGSTLPPFSPLLPPAALSQILLLSNPLRSM
ncbi:ADP-ribosylation factor-binding protein GGA2-like, partial [Clarias magur]